MARVLAEMGAADRSAARVVRRSRLGVRFTDARPVSRVGDGHRASAYVWAVARPLVAVALVAVLAAVLVAPVAPAHATVTPSSGDPRAAFEIAFSAQAVGLDLQLAGPGRCGDLHISIRRARHGRFSGRKSRARVRGATASACAAGVAAATASRSSPPASLSRARAT
jgi:hypothetical protein